MSLIDTLNIGKSALAVHQAAIQVTSNNIANAGNPDYTRQVATAQPSRDRMLKPGMFLGTGVNLASIQRQIDEALEQRIRGSVSDTEAAEVRQQWFGRLEAVFQAMGENSLSTQMSDFFNKWSNLANEPQDIGLRDIVVKGGESLAGTFRSLFSQTSSLQTEVDKRLAGMANQANSLAGSIADLNEQIITAEAGNAPSANGLRDQRDAALKQLSQLIDIKVQDIGPTINVLVGSEPLILGTTSRGIALKQTSDGANILTKIVNKDNGGTLDVTSGQIGGLTALRQDIQATMDQVDDLAKNLIFELNKLHGSGQGLEGFTQATATNAVNDMSAALNDADKTGLTFNPTNGSFVVHVKQKGTGTVTSTLVAVDLDGLNGNDTTLNSLRASLDAIDGVSATIADGKLRISAESSGAELSFSEDSSGVLAALGVNSFFTGRGAGEMGINADLKTRPSLLAAAMNGEPGDNQTARKIAELEKSAVGALGGLSIKDSYQNMIDSIATSARDAETNAEAASTVKDTLLSQREALSGVSMDEEAINLIRDQRAFQGAARVIAAVDELLKTLLSLA